LEKWPKYTGPNWYLQAAVRWSCANFDDWHWMHDCWLFEFCNRKASKCRSINSRTNHSIFRWFLPLHWLFLDLLCFVWHISFRFVSSFFVSFSFLSLAVPRRLTWTSPCLFTSSAHWHTTWIFIGIIRYLYHTQFSYFKNKKFGLVQLLQHTNLPT
jgi:hypothetical protein